MCIRDSLYILTVHAEYIIPAIRYILDCAFTGEAAAGEMCIRDSIVVLCVYWAATLLNLRGMLPPPATMTDPMPCLLYTSI